VSAPVDTGCPCGLVTAEPCEAPRLARVLSAAFADNPVSDWLFHGEQDRHHPAFFGAFLRWAFAGGRVEQSADGTAVAVWLDRTAPADAERLDRFDGEVTEAVGRHLVRWRMLDQATGAEHPVVPHWWLAFLGVLPGTRGRGQAGRLLSGARDWQPGAPAYLEATSRRLSSFYLRHGYRATDTVHVPLGPSLHGMWRDAPS
jgi:hypothetical protein